MGKSGWGGIEVNERERRGEKRESGETKEAGCVHKGECEWRRGGGNG